MHWSVDENHQVLNNQCLNLKEDQMKGYLNFFTVLGALFLIAAGVVYSQGSSMRQSAVLTTGIVIGTSVSTNSDDITSYCPQVEFTTGDGRKVVHSPNVCSTTQEYENGEQVEIYYDPAAPDKAQIKGFWTEYGITTLLGGIGLPILAVGIFAGWLASPSARKSK